MSTTPPRPPGHSAVAALRRSRGLAPRPVNPFTARRQQAAAANNGLSGNIDSGSLSSRIADIDSRSEQSRTGSARLHVSAVAGDWCARRHALHYLYPDSMIGSAPPRSADRLLWAIGRAVEHHIRTTLIESLGAQNVYGTWTCLCRALTYTGLGQRSPAHCPRCGAAQTNYRELVLAPEQECVFVGSPDMVILADGHLRPLEIKSIKRDSFMALTAPQPDHWHQVSMYVPLLRMTVREFPVADMVHVVYGAKDYTPPGVLPYKDYALEASTVATGSMMPQAHQQLGPVLRGESRALPQRLPACSSQGATRARNCSACALCFSLNS